MIRLALNTLDKLGTFTEDIVCPDHHNDEITFCCCLVVFFFFPFFLIAVTEYLTKITFKDFSLAYSLRAQSIMAYKGVHVCLCVSVCMPVSVFMPVCV